MLRLIWRCHSALGGAATPAGLRPTIAFRILGRGDVLADFSKRFLCMSSGAMYAAHFGLKQRPFTLLPDPDFLFWSPEHRRAYSVLEIGILSRAPITLVTGEIGSGKTTLLRQLMNRMEEDLSVGLISNFAGAREDLMRWVLNAFGLQVPEDHPDDVHRYQVFVDFLVQEYASGRRVILIIDEAQNLSVDALEELRMLTNVNSVQDEVFQLILVGQAELRDRILRPKLKQVAQRIAASFHLGPMRGEEVQDYVRHRLQSAGGSGDEFSDGALVLIHKNTDGIPRLVNQLCDLSLMYAWTDDEEVVSAETVEAVLQDKVFFGAQLLGGAQKEQQA